MDRLEYLHSIIALIRNTVPRDTTGGINVAKLGLTAKRSLPDWRDLGYLKLKDILAELEAQSLVRTGLGDKNAFTVWLVEAPSTPEPVIGSQPPAVPPLQPLRREVWIAFTSPFPPGRRFLNRNSGEVRMGMTQPPEPGGEWIELSPIDQQTQRQWALEFLDQSHPPDDQRLRSALAADDWYRRLPAALDQCGSFWKSQFNRRRSARVQQIASDWKEQNGLPLSVVFAAEYSRPRRMAQSSSTTIDQRGVGRDDRSDKSAPTLRQMLMRALASMSTEELCEIALPAKYLIPVLRPDLNSSGANGSNR